MQFGGNVLRNIAIDHNQFESTCVDLCENSFKNTNLNIDVPDSRVKLHNKTFAMVTNLAKCHFIITR